MAGNQSSLDIHARPSSLDIHARPFIPQVLRQVNAAPASILSYEPPPWIDYALYVKTFAGTRFLSAPPPLDASIEPASGLSNDHEAEALMPENYQSLFSVAILAEISGQKRECEEHALHRVPLVAAERDPRAFMYLLHVPGLRETDLRIEIGDVVHVRQLQMNARGDVQAPPTFSFSNQDWKFESQYLTKQHDARVWSVDRRDELLSIKLGPWFTSYPVGWGPTYPSHYHNVSFSIQTRRFNALHRAVGNVPALLNTAMNSWMRSVSFPQESDGHLQTHLNSIHFTWKAYDPSLNWEQLQAVDAILKDDYGRVPFLVSGPPGTGKTKTVVETALQLLNKSRAARLLVCAPSDPASDTLTARLSKFLQPKDLLRLNAPSRSFAEVPDTILAYCYIENEIFNLPDVAALMQKKIVIVTCRDADILAQARLTNSDLFALERSMHTILHPESEIQPSLHWTGLIIDEAAQATEPEALLPLLVVAPPTDFASAEHKALPAVVLVGDQHQLGPRTASKHPLMQTSLFERLLARPLYAKHPLARSATSDGSVRPLTPAMLPLIRPPFANLIRNYRSHPAILATPSSLFYNDTLEPCAEDTAALTSWTGFPNPSMPVLFAPNASPDQVEVLDGGGWLNVGEAHRALHFARSLLAAFANSLTQKDICIMSPFRAQVRLLRHLARQGSPSAPQPLWGLNIGPLEAYQGLEERVVIVCTTRTQDRFIDQDIARGLGVIHEPRRFNVALTRAKQALIVIGNPDVLRQDDSWATFMAFCARSGCWEGQQRPGDDLPRFQRPRARISRLEKQMAFRRAREEARDAVDAVTGRVRTLGLDRSEEHDLWVSGLVAERAVAEGAEDHGEEDHGEEDHGEEDHGEEDHGEEDHGEEDHGGQGPGRGSEPEG